MFVTSVTAGRQPILIESIGLFHEALSTAQQRQPFESIAWVVLPDHFHLIANCHMSDTSSLMRRIKLSFSSRYREKRGLDKGSIWQKRFWDHAIRDQSDMNRHIDYIHYNSVRHGLCDRPLNWRYSSFSDFVERGFYEADWGAREPARWTGDFGE